MSVFRTNRALQNGSWSDDARVSLSHEIRQVVAKANSRSVIAIIVITTRPLAFLGLWLLGFSLRRLVGSGDPILPRALATGLSAAALVATQLL